MTDRVIRLSLDINVLFEDRLAVHRGTPGTASSYLVDAVREGYCPAGPVQLIVSVPMIENWASVLVPNFKYSNERAQETAWLLHDYASEGTIGTPPNIASW